MTVYEKTFHWMKKPQSIILLLLLLSVGYFFVDKPLAFAAYGLQLRDNVMLTLLTNLGKWSLYAAWFAIAALYFRYLRINPLYEHRAWFLFGCVLLPTLVNGVLKVTLSRARPDLLFLNGDYGFYWLQFKDLYWSFPSGHAMTCGALVAGLSVLFPRYFWGVLSLAVLIAATRVLLYKHFLTDVLFGFYLGVLITGFYSQYFRESVARLIKK